MPKLSNNIFKQRRLQQNMLRLNLCLLLFVLLVGLFHNGFRPVAAGDDDDESGGPNSSVRIEDALDILESTASNSGVRTSLIVSCKKSNIGIFGVAGVDAITHNRYGGPQLAYCDCLAGGRRDSCIFYETPILACDAAERSGRNAFYVVKILRSNPERSCRNIKPVGRAPINVIQTQGHISKKANTRPSQPKKNTQPRRG